MSKTIEGIKLIQHNASGINLPDDPSYPWRLDASFSLPEFMIFGGSETIVVRGMTYEALDKFAELNDLYHHPRLRKLYITQPESDSI